MKDLKLVHKIILPLSHLIVAPFAAWGILMGRAFSWSPDAPDPGFGLEDIKLFVCALIFFVLPVLLFIKNQAYYAVIGLFCYLLFFFDWLYFVLYALLPDGDFSDPAFLFYLFYALIYLYALLIFVVLTIRVIRFTALN